MNANLSYVPRKVLLNIDTGFDGDQNQVPFGAIDDFLVTNLRLAIVFGMGIGACGIMALTFLFFHHSRKKTPMFWLCEITLVSMIIRLVLLLVYFLGPLASPSVNFTGRALPSFYSAYQSTVAGNAFRVISIACVELVLVFQTYVVFRSPEVRQWGRALSAAMAILALLTVGFYINSAIVSSRASHSLIEKGFFAQSQNNNSGWVNNVPLILFSASINLMSLVLVAKLAFAIRTRRYLGLKQFDSYHVLVIMGTQTMIIPAILVIFNYATGKTRATLSEVANILVVINLPLSCMWSMAANNKPRINNSHLRRADLDSNSNSTSSADYSFLPWKLNKYASEKSTETAFSEAPTAVMLRGGRNDIKKLPLSGEVPYAIERIFADEETSTASPSSSVGFNELDPDARERHLGQYANNRIVQTKVHHVKY